MKIAGISSKKLGDPNEGLLDNKNLYNDKELFDDADLDWYDYGFRNYDPQIGRFPQLDPLTNYYPELTPYQYASNEPIANIDVDGLEGFNSLQTLETVTIKLSIKAAPAATSLATKLIIKLALVTAKGVSDALLNANTIGLSDAFGNNHLDSYDSPDEKAAYLRGRLGGDAIAIAQGADEASIGGGIALTTGAETFGVGAGAGALVGLHGAGVAGTATSDAIWATKKLYQLNIVLSEATSAGASKTIELVQPPDTEVPSGSNWKKEPPAFAKDAKWGKNSSGKKGWIDKKGNFITKGDKPGEWHVNPNPKTRNPLWNGQKPRYKSKQPYWNVKDNGAIHH